MLMFIEEHPVKLNPGKLFWVCLTVLCITDEDDPVGTVDKDDSAGITGTDPAGTNKDESTMHTFLLLLKISDSASL